MNSQRAPLLTVREVAELLGCIPETVRVMARRGEIPSKKLGTKANSRYRFDPEAIREYVALLPNGGK